MSDSEQNPDREEQDEVLPNSAAEEFFGRMKRDFKRPKPSQAAIASALQAIQKLTGEVNLETEANPPAQAAEGKCPKCGAGNSAMNRFCGYCGTLMDREQKPRTVQAQPSSEGQHIYHHHYHHHYFSESEEAAKSADVQVNSRNQAEPPPVETHEDAADAIQKLVQNWGRCFNTKRLDELMGLYSSDSIVLRPNAGPAHGNEAIRQLMQSALDAGLADVQLDCADIGIVGDFACLTGRSKMLVPSAPARRHEESGKYLIVVRREGGKWKIVADSWCMDAPKPAPASASAPVLPMRGQRKS